MKVGKNKFVFDCLTDDILNESLDPGNIFQYMLISLSYFAFDEYLG